MTPQQEADKLWQATLGELEVSLSKANFTTWFHNTFIVEIRESEVLIGVPNAFTKAWLENKYHKAILASLQHISEGAIQRASYSVAQKGASAMQSADTYVGDAGAGDAGIAEVSTEKTPTNHTTATPMKPGGANAAGFNPRYTFNMFIVGKSNQLANAAAHAVSEKPGEVYNPLFVYGASGLGKTHLLQAIGQQILSTWPNKIVIYVTCEKFTNEFISAISKGTMEAFKAKYRNADALLIDDVQFLSNKEGTQEEFFHTFNALHEANHQIILSSDRPPKAIRELEERLVSRFEWGMLVDLGSPDLETRMAILNAKCKEHNYPLDVECVNYVARHAQSNIRELEGVLNRIMAYHSLNKIPPTLENIKEIMQTNQRHSNQKQRALTSKDVVLAVVTYFGISQANLLGSSRQKELVVPRQIAMFLLREELKSSYPSIGHEMGNRDHTTAMHAYEKIRLAVEDDEKIRRDVLHIRQRLY